MAPLGLVALDGADDDGGTLYVLMDDGRPILTAAWPQPLMQYASDHGREVVRLPCWGGAPVDDIPDMPRRRPMTDMLTDLNPGRERDDDRPTVGQIVQALADTRVLIAELERHVEEERDNLARILDELEPYAKGA